MKLKVSVIVYIDNNAHFFTYLLEEMFRLHILLKGKI